MWFSILNCIAVVVSFQGTNDLIPIWMSGCWVHVSSTGNCLGASRLASWPTLSLRGPRFGLFLGATLSAVAAALRGLGAGGAGGFGCVFGVAGVVSFLTLARFQFTCTTFKLSFGTGSWTLCPVGRVRAAHSVRSLVRQVRGARAVRLGLVVGIY